MPDYGSRYTEKRQRLLELRLKRVYTEAQKDLQKTLDSFIAKKERKQQEKLAQVKAGKITEQEYKDWLSGQVFIEKQWKAKVQQATDILFHSNEKAVSMVRDEQMNVFTENANYQAYQVEKTTGFQDGISFELYDMATVDRLIQEKPELLPRSNLKERKDRAWNQGIIANAITQGIIQGATIPQIAKRIAKDIASRNTKAMIRYARTAITGAENAGRMETMRRAENMGINVKKQWLATLDRRTRDSHRHLDGQIRKIDEPFESELGEIMYPGDPEAEPGDVYNCRCTLTYIYPDYPSPASERIAYDEWEDEEGSHRESFIMGQDTNYGDWLLEKKRRHEGTGGQSFERKSTANKPIYTQKEKDALHEYTLSTYSGINTLLREGGLSNYPQLQEAVEEIDRAMAKSIIPQGTIVSRGATDADLRGLFKEHKRNWFEKYDNLKSIEGETASYDSYLSTTRGATVAEPYKNQVEWVLEVGEGVHGIDMMPFANQGKAEVEREILFARGQNITINKVECNEDDDGYIYGIITIHATIKRKKAKSGERNIHEPQEGSA